MPVESLPASGTPQSVVYIVDDDRTTHELLQATFRSSEYELRAFASAVDFLQAATYDLARPACLVSDVCMPNIDGLALQRRLRARRVDMPIIFVTAVGGIPVAVDAMKDGAFDFIEKPIDIEHLRTVVSAALEHDQGLKLKRSAGTTFLANINRLTPREREVMELLATAKSTKQIGTALNISTKTVFVHRSKVLEKLGLDNTVQLSKLYDEHVTRLRG